MRCPIYITNRGHDSTPVALSITSSASVNVAENVEPVTTVTAIGGVTPYTFYISGGADEDLFEINSTTGVLSFKDPADYELPGDSDQNNVYEVNIQVVDNVSAFVNQDMTVTVTNVSAPSDHEFRISTVSPIVQFESNSSKAIATLTAEYGTSPYIWTREATFGTDYAAVAIDQNTGELTFVEFPNFSAPLDQDSDNVYVIDIRCVDANNLNAVKTINVQILQLLQLDGNANPSMDENTTIVESYSGAGGFPPYTYSISTAEIEANEDASLLSINSTTGVLSFIAAPDYEDPIDFDFNNIYRVQLVVTDGENNISTQDVSVTVNDVSDDPLQITTVGSFNVTENSVIKDVIEFAASGGTGGPYTWNFDTSGSPADYEDNSKFDLADGLLSFVDFTDFEEPNDVSHDNIYKIRVRCTDGVQTVYANFAITVIDDPLASIAPTADFDIDEGTPDTIFNASALFTPGIGEHTYSLDGVDAGFFNINSTTGAVSVNYSAGDFDYEIPQDNGGDNIYNFTVNVADENGEAASCDVTVNCMDVDDDLKINGGASVGFNINENQHLLHEPWATGGYPPYSWSITGGLDAGVMEIDADAGDLTSSVDWPDGFDYETPADSDGDNTYVVVIRVTDSTSTYFEQTVSIAIQNVVETSPLDLQIDASLDDPFLVNVVENSSTVAIAAGTGGTAPYSYSITGGDDASLFTVNSSSGQIAFIDSPDFEMPADVGTDNVYEVEVTVTDAMADSVTHAVHVTVTDEDPEGSPLDLNIDGQADDPRDLYINENATTTFTATGTGGTSPYHYDVSGTDASFITIDHDTGEFGFATPKDYESPDDSDGNNIYEFYVTVGDDVMAQVDHLVRLHVADVDPENYPPTVAPSGSTSCDWNSYDNHISGYVIVDDPDDDDLIVTITTTDGQFMITSGAVTFTTGTADTYASTLVFSGTKSNVSDACSTYLYFKPNENFFGDAHFEVTVDDSIAAPVTDSTFVITVNQVRSYYLRSTGSDSNDGSVGSPVASFAKAASLAYNTSPSQRIWFIIPDGEVGFNDLYAGDMGAINPSARTIGTVVPLTIMQMTPQPCVIDGFKPGHPQSYGALNLTLSGVSITNFVCAQDHDQATPSIDLGSIRSGNVYGGTIANMNISGDGGGLAGESPGPTSPATGADGGSPGAAGANADASGSSGTDGGNGRCGMSITLVGSITVTSFASLGSSGGPGGNGANANTATAGNGADGPAAYDDGIGTPADGGAGGNGGDAYSTGGDGGNGGRGGDGGIITLVDGATVSAYDLSPGTGGGGGTAGSYGSASGGSGGAGGSGVNGGNTGDPGIHGTAYAFDGTPGSSGADGTAGSIV